MDAYTESRQEWQYRYNPMGERESKWEVRRGLVLDNQTDSLLPWQYYLLGGAKEQRAVWNGRLHSKSLCSDTGRRVYFYPSEYLTYGGGSRSITTRPNGDREYAIVDHLGSTRVVLDSWGNPIMTKDYEPFGAEVMPGAGPRKSWIDRQQDGESGLRNHGVRQYDLFSGRFVSVDPWFEVTPSLSVYSYAGSTPVSAKDWTGKILAFANKFIENDFYQAMDYLRENGVEVDAVLDGLRNSATYYVVTPDNGGGNRVTGTENQTLIYWNSHKGLAYFALNESNMGGWNYTSPAIGIWHELGHALFGDVIWTKSKYYGRSISYDSYLKRQLRDDPYKDYSEYTIITGWEWPAIQKTDEAAMVRPCWQCANGTVYDFVTDSPTSNVPKTDP